MKNHTTLRKELEEKGVFFISYDYITKLYVIMYQGLMIKNIRILEIVKVVS